MALFNFFIAFRHLRNRRRSFLSTITIIAILGVFLGVTALTSVISVTGGFQEAFRSRVLGINSHIVIQKYGIDFRDYREIADDVRLVPGVVAASPFIFHQMIATHDHKNKGILIKGIDPATFSEVSDLPKYMSAPGLVEKLKYDRFPRDGKRDIPKVVVGKFLAEKLNLKVGDEMAVASPLESLDPKKWEAKERSGHGNRFEVIGFYDSGFYEYDSRLVITDYRALQDFFQQGDQVTGLDLRVEDVFSVHILGDILKRILPEGRFRVLDWQQLNHNLFASLSLQRLVLSVLFFFIVVVASFNIVSTLIMIVLDKQKEIAILKSMGARHSDITGIFIIEGFVIGTIGTIAGLIGGVVVCQIIKYTDYGLDPAIYMIDYLPVRMEPFEFGIVGLLALVISLLATIGPSLWAARLKPVDGLRFD